MNRRVIALFTGFSILNIVVLISKTIFVPEKLGMVIANFLGGLCAGFICKKRGALYGAVLSVCYFLMLVIILACIAYKASEGRVFLPGLPGMGIMIIFIVSIFFGLIGGVLGEKLSKSGKE